jgi:hypothetical protein
VQGVPSPEFDVACKLAELLRELFVKNLARVEEIEKAVIFLSTASHYRLRERTILLHTLVVTVGTYRGREREEFRHLVHPFLRELMADLTMEDATMRFLVVRWVNIG